MKLSLGTIPDHWRWETSGEVIDVRDGTHDTPKYIQNGFPLITSKNLKAQGIDFEDVGFISEQDHMAISKRSRVDRGDILFAMIGTIGNPVVVTEDREFSIKNVALFKCTKGRVDPLYCYRLLGSPLVKMQLAAATRGGTQKFVSLKVLRNLQIPLPPLSEQKRIAGILDAADKLRAIRRESLAQLDTLLQSTFLDLFGDPVTNPMGWEVKPLAYGVESFEGGKNLTPTDLDRPDSVRVLKVSAVTSGEYRPDQSKAFSSEEIVQSSHMVKKGDLLISRANTAALVGAVCHVWDTVGLEMLPDKLWRFIWNESRRIEPLFMLHLARSDYFREQLIQRATGTSGSMKNIGKKKMLEIPIPYPPVDLQHHFATIVQSIEQQKASQRAHLAELDTLFAALQQRAFNGEL